MSAAPLDLLQRALDQALDVIARVGESDLDSPTPCRSWDVRTVLNHLVHDLENFKVAAHGGRPNWRGPVPEVSGDRVAAFEIGAASLLEAWRATEPVDAAINQQISELAVHAWDVATAIGAKIEWDDALASAGLQWAQGAMKPEFRGDEASGMSFGPEVSVSATASAQDRLVAFFGRDPGNAA